MVLGKNNKDLRTRSCKAGRMSHPKSNVGEGKLLLVGQKEPSDWGAVSGDER